LRSSAGNDTVSRVPFPLNGFEIYMSRWKGLLRRRGHERHAALLNSLHECVDQIRPRTAAALAVVLRGSSGSYRDVAVLFGATVAWLGLIVILFLPNEVHPGFVPLDVLVLFLLAAWYCSRSRLRRWLTTRRRWRKQARTAAHAAFVEEGVLHTKQAQGVLVYWSLLERHVEIVADVGVVRAMPQHDWNAVVFALRRAGHHPHGGAAFVEQVRALGDLLAKHMPPNQRDEQPALPIGGER
jgi:putative membrane protein